MSPDKQINTAAELVHERARDLAAESIDGPLSAGDTAWLASHLGSCEDCQSVAEEYRANHLELGALEMPEPPRDLWARTSAAFDAIDAAARRPAPGRAPAPRASRRPVFGTALAVGVVVLAAAVSLLIQSPLPSNPGFPSQAGLAAVSGSAGPSGAAPQALAVVNGTSYWISSDGSLYEIKGGATQCTSGDGTCTVATGSTQTLGTISSDSAVSAVIAPNAGSAAVWTSDKVAIVPLSPQAGTVALNDLTPRPTVAATPTATPTAKPTATPKPVATATPAATASVAPSAGLTSSTPTPTPLVTLEATATTTATAVATAVPTSSAVAAGAQPTAILSGYEVVGPDPEFSPDGTMVAFSARPVDHSTGPDVFIWRTGQEQAQPLKTAHSGLFAGWFGSQLLISEIASAQGAEGPAYASFVYNPVTATLKRISRPMLQPAIDPTGRYLVYWSGTVEFDPASGLWQPGKGDLYFDLWSNLTLETVSSVAIAPAATPTVAPTAVPPSPSGSPVSLSSAGISAAPKAFVSATPTAPPTAAATPKATQAPALPQVLPVAAGPGLVHVWVVRWDSAGQNLAVWVANPGSTRIGRLGVFTVDRAANLVNVNEPRLAADNVLSAIQFDSGHLVYTSAVDGKTYMQAVPSVPPSTAATPSPTSAGQLPASGAPASAIPSDRPGN